jgi:type IV secretion system protein VirD4
MKKSRAFRFVLNLTIYNVVFNVLLIPDIDGFINHSVSSFTAIVLNSIIANAVGFVISSAVFYKRYRYWIFSDFNVFEIMGAYIAYYVIFLYTVYAANADHSVGVIVFDYVLIPSTIILFLAYYFSLSSKDRKILTSNLDANPNVRTVRPDVIPQTFNDYLGSLKRKGVEHGSITAQTVIPTGDVIRDMDVSHGSARWLSDTEKNKLTEHYKPGTKDASGNSLTGASFQGLWIGGGFFHHEEGNLCCCAPPGIGKGGALIIPNLLWKRDYKHSFVVFDPKGTNAQISARFQQECGQRVIIIDPMKIQDLGGATHNIALSSFNPLDFIVNNIYSGSRLIGNLMLPDAVGAKDQYWTQKARQLLQTVVMHVMTDEKYKDDRNFLTVYKLLSGGKLKELFLEMIININSEMHEQIKNVALDFIDLMKADTTFAGVISHVTNSVDWISNPALQTVLTHSSFSPNELANGGITLYLCQPVGDSDQFAVFSRLVIGSIMRANYTPSPTPKEWVYYLLDEFPSMGTFPEIVDSLALAREYKMRIFLFMQGLSQLDIVYGEVGRHRILGTIGVFQTIKLSDYQTQVYMSHRIGETTETVNSETHTKSSGTQKTHSQTDGSGSSVLNETSDVTTKNQSQHARYLIQPNELQLDGNIITVFNKGVMRLSLWQYWQKPIDDTSGYYAKKFTDGRADRNPNY